MAARIIPTEYPDFPARFPITFYGPPTRQEYVAEGDKYGRQSIDFGQVLRDRADFLRQVLKAANGILLKFLQPPYETLTEEQLAEIVKVMNAFTSSGGDGGYGVYDDKSGRTTVYRTGRVEKMMVYEDFFNFVELLSKLQPIIQKQLANKGVKSSTLNLLRTINRMYPTLLMHLRVTPMGPEPNQVTNMCETQFLFYQDPKTKEMIPGSSQRDQCNTVYDMCRGKQDQFGVIDHTRDLLCTRYIKSKVFPKESQDDRDVRVYFNNYDYARDGSAFLKKYAQQHDWQKEYDVNVVSQWDTKYSKNDPYVLENQARLVEYNPQSEYAIDYSDRKAYGGSKSARQAQVQQFFQTKQSNVAARQLYEQAMQSSDLYKMQEEEAAIAAARAREAASVAALSKNELREYQQRELARRLAKVADFQSTVDNSNLPGFEEAQDRVNTGRRNTPRLKRSVNNL